MYQNNFNFILKNSLHTEKGTHLIAQLNEFSEADHTHITKIQIKKQNISSVL